MPSAPTETIHATCVALDGLGVLLIGPSGSGKSDLALRLIDRGAELVSDDYCIITDKSGHLIASPPPNIAGKLEIRHIGIIEMKFRSQAPVALAVRLEEKPPRMPDSPSLLPLLDRQIPLVTLAPLEASAPIKVEQALRHFGLSAPLP